MTNLDPQECSATRAAIEAGRKHFVSLSIESSDCSPSGIGECSFDERRLGLLVLGSGSKGNAALVMDCQSGHGVLIDAGICKRDIFAFAKQGGFCLSNLKGIVITHAHSDHVKNLDVVLRGLKKEGISVPIYIHQEMLQESKSLQKLAPLGLFEFFEAKQQLTFGTLHFQPFLTSHDTSISFGFRITCGQDALGWVTDTGILTPEALEDLKNVRILGLESNHDSVMLKNGPYPQKLKERVGSDNGHLSNMQAANALKTLISPRLETVVALHISENNNTYRLAVEALRSMVDQLGSKTQVTCAYQSRPVFVLPFPKKVEN